MAASPSAQRPSRRAARRNYVEPDSEPESESDFEIPGPSRVPRRAARQSAVLQVSSEDEESDSSSAPSDGGDRNFVPGVALSSSSRAPRRSARQSAVHEVSHEDEESDSSSALSDGGDRNFVPGVALSSSSRAQRPISRSQSQAHRDSERSRRRGSAFRIDIPAKHDSRLSPRKRSHAARSSKRRKLNNSRHLSLRSASDSKPALTPQIPPGKIPPWQTLEHQILVKIMQYAAPMPINKHETGAVRWLLNTSELCTSFHQACISVLLYCPPLLPAHRAHWLVNLLKASARDYGDLANENDTPPSTKKLSLDYRRKVNHLNVEVKQLLQKKQGIDLSELLQLTPLLKGLRLYHNHDIFYSNHLFAQAIHSKDKWSYTDALFDVLDECRIHLSSFEWNGRFLKKDVELNSLPVYHTRPCLTGLTSLTLRNLNVSNVEKDVDQLNAARANLLAALSSLDRLTSLSFDRCNILDSITLGTLPSTRLTELSVSACPHITSEGIDAYLTRAGTSLKSLTLSGNQVLSLSFLSKLNDLCPHLEEIAIDLTFKDPTSFQDTEPLFDELLPSGAPTWPPSLRSISIGPLRALSSSDAEDFYHSLINAADSLPYLRTLVIKTILNDISWRDRAKMRSRWLGLLNDVFAQDTSAQAAPISISMHDPSSDQDASTKTSKRKSARLLSTPAAPTATGDVKGNENGNVDVSKRQNRCDVVIFELSDQRPAQDQYNEQDFLDDEPSDDADWDGRDDVVVPTYGARRYAW